MGDCANYAVRSVFQVVLALDLKQHVGRFLASECPDFIVGLW